MDYSIVEIILFILFIFSSGFLEAAEIAISSVGENKIEELKQQQNGSVLFFEQIQADPEIFFGSLRILHTTFTIIAALLGVKILVNNAKFVGDINWNSGLLNAHLALLFVIIIIVASIIIVICLLIPRAIGVKYSTRLAVNSVSTLLAISFLMKLPVKMLTAISNLLLMPFKEKTNFTQSRPSEDEILDIISDGVKSGAIDESEQEIIENILEFNDLKAQELMIPRTEMIAIDLSDNNDVNVKKIIHSGHSLIPAYKETPDNIVGVIHTKDMMKQYLDGNPVLVNQLLRPAYFIPETKPISEVLKEMQQIGERLVIVTDEYGGTEGVITLEDVLEEIVGEIKDLTKVEVSEFSKFADGTYCILGSMDIDDFNETFSYKLPESEEYYTIAGFISEKTGKILNQGESFEFEGIQFELIKKIRQKMVQFKVHSDKDDFKNIA
jgi:putative hemolysin